VPGYSHGESGHSVGRRVEEHNIFGAPANELSFQVSTGSINQVYSPLLHHPYITDDGVSRVVRLVPSERWMQSNLSAIGSSLTRRRSANGVRFRVPITEYDTSTMGWRSKRTRSPAVPIRRRPTYDLSSTKFGSSRRQIPGQRSAGTRDKRDSVNLHHKRKHDSEITEEVARLPEGGI